MVETTKSIDQIIPMVNSVGNSGNQRDDLVEKATCMMAMVTWAQPFFDGNRTGIVAAIKFLRDNGYVDIDPKEENLELRCMLSEIKKHASGLEPRIMGQCLFIF